MFFDSHVVRRIRPSDLGVLLMVTTCSRGGVRVFPVSSRMNYRLPSVHFLGSNQISTQPNQVELSPIVHMMFLTRIFCLSPLSGRFPVSNLSRGPVDKTHFPFDRTTILCMSHFPPPSPCTSLFPRPSFTLLETLDTISSRLS